MSDHDRFERDLRAALRAYAGGVSSDLDSALFARSIALAEPRRRPFGVAGLHWPVAPTGRLAFVLLLVALLLAAALAVANGFRPPVELPAVVPGIPAVHACPAGSTPDEPGPFEQARPPIGEIRVAVDRESGRLVAVVPASEGTGPWETWMFDLCSNRWSGPEPGPSAATGNFPPELVYDWRMDLTLAIRRDEQIAAFDAGTGRWRTRGTALPGQPLWDRLVYEARSGHVLLLAATTYDSPSDGVELWQYDPAVDEWTAVGQSGTGPSVEDGDHTLIAYDTAMERVVAMNAENGRTWVFDTGTATWVDQRRPPPPLSTGYFALGGELAYDDAAARVVFYADGDVATYDPVANAWEVAFESPRDWEWGSVGPQARGAHRMVYDPTNRRLVVLGGGYRTTGGWVDADDVWAFETGTGTWRQLLAPSHLVTR